MTIKPLITNATIIAFYDNKEIHRTDNPKFNHFWKYGYIDREAIGKN